MKVVCNERAKICKHAPWSEGDVWFALGSKQQKLRRVDIYTLPLLFALLLICLQHVLSKSAQDVHASGQYTLDQKQSSNIMVTEILPEPVAVDPSGSAAIENLDHIQVSPQKEEGMDVTFAADVQVPVFEVITSSSSPTKPEARVPGNKPKKQQLQTKLRVNQGERYQRAKRLFVHGKVVQAKNVLAQVSRLTRKEKQLLAKIYVVACKNWVAQDDVQKALIDCQKALDLSKHPTAKQFLRESEKHAKELYLQGYAIENIDPQKAKQMYMQAMLYAPKQSVWKYKSLQRLQ